jgi:MFS family permease
LTETPVFEELRRRRALSAETPLRAVVRDYRAAIVLSGLLTWMLSAAIVVVVLMTPTLLQKVYHVQTIATLQANCLATIALAAGCILAGWLIDRFGTARVLLVGCPLSGIATYLLYAGVRLDSSLVMPLYALAGFTVGVVAVVPCVMIAAFPPPIRFSGISFSYNLAWAIFGGLTPILVSWMLPFDPLAPAYYVGALCLLGCGVGIFLVSASSRRPSWVAPEDTEIES